MLVADLQVWNPSVLHVGMVVVRDVQAAPIAHSSFVTMIKVLEPMEIVEIPEDGGMLAIDFESIKGFMAASVARGFKPPF